MALLSAHPRPSSDIGWAFDQLLVPTMGHLLTKGCPGVGHLTIESYFVKACFTQMPVQCLGEWVGLDQESPYEQNFSLNCTTQGPVTN